MVTETVCAPSEPRNTASCSWWRAEKPYHRYDDGSTVVIAPDTRDTINHSCVHRNHPYNVPEGRMTPGRPEIVRDGRLRCQCRLEQRQGEPVTQWRSRRNIRT